ncbi:MAG: hypothetical protein WD941_00350 [Opitutus sp.]
MIVDDKSLLAFLGPQMRDYGGKLEIEPGVWVLFAVETADAETNKLALWLLAGAPFASNSASSEDDQWTLYHVNTTQREEAIHWLDELSKVASGQIRPVSPTQRALISELGRSGLPHRVALRLAEQKAHGKLSAGCVQEPLAIRTLLDRLHSREPLFFAALQTLLNHHLIDLIALLQQLIEEDLSLAGEIGRSSLSHTPFPQTAQIVADDILSLLRRFHVINPLDDETNAGGTNPYANYMEIARDGDKIVGTLNGNPLTLPRASFVDAIRSTRRSLYWGSAIDKIDTQVSWMRDEIAYSFRFIKQRLIYRRELSAMDGLYMLERAVED